MLDAKERQILINRIRYFPAALKALVADLSDEQLNTKYLPDEWTIQQIVHHLPDSHMNSIIRLKHMLTTDNPTLQGYDQDVWVELPDVLDTPIESSLLILQGLHERWSTLFESLSDEQWERYGQHTESGKMTVEELLQYYAGHGEEHIEQIQRILRAADD